MTKFNVFSVVILVTAFVCIFSGVLLFWSVRKPGTGNSPRATNRIAWLLIALFPVLILFSFFPSSSTVSGSILGFSATGAAALFVFIWWYGSKSAIQSIEADEISAEKRSGLLDQQQRIEQLNNRIQALQTNLDNSQKLSLATEKPQILTTTQVFRYPLRSSTNKSIGLITGNLEGVRGADIWVNSENNNMQMSRWYEGTISGMIRYLGARKDDGGEIVENGDIIALELGRKMGTRSRVEPTTVFITSPGELAKSPYNVKAILHVASVQGAPGLGYSPIPNVEECVTKVLQLAESESAEVRGCESIVFPLLGSGTGKAQIDAIAQKLLPKAINHLESNPNGRINCIYFLAWTDLHLEKCKLVLRTGGKVDIRD